MGVGQGLRAVLGVGVESTWGTTVPVTKRFEFVNENLQRQQSIIQSQGISGRAVTMRRGARRRIETVQAAGDITLECGKQGMGVWLNHMLGGTSAITQQGATAAWLQEHAFGSLLEKGLTVQKAIRDGAGTVLESFTYSGCKIPSWSLSVAVGQIPQLTVSLDCRDIVSGTSTTTLLGLPEQPGGVYAFLDAFLEVDSTAVARVLSAELAGNNSLKTDSIHLGSTGRKSEQEVNDWREVTGTLTAEFLESTIHDLYEADTGADLVLSFVGENIASTFDEELTITIPDVRFTGETPTVGGAGVVEMTHPFEATFNDVDDPIAVDYMSRDTTIAA